MGKRQIRSGILLALVLCLLTGCAPLLERTYSAVEPHSSKFWESEAADTLRAESYQDIVNDLLILIGQHTETATLRLYNYEDDLAVAETLEKATTEIKQETPMGAYAVEYITSSSQAQRGYYEIALEISYRRTAEQIQSVVNATSPEALRSLLDTAIDSGKTELAVRLGYWGSDGEEKLRQAMDRVRERRKVPEEEIWLVNYYPEDGPVELVEFLLDPPPELIPPPEEIVTEETEEAESVEDADTDSAESSVEGDAEAVFADSGEKPEGEFVPEEKVLEEKQKNSE